MTAEHLLSAEELMALLDGELAPAHAAVVRAHVASCESCRRLSAELRGISRDVKRWEVEDPPDSFMAPAGVPPARGAWLKWVVRQPTVLVGSLSALMVVAVLASAVYDNHVMPRIVTFPDTSLSERATDEPLPSAVTASTTAPKHTSALSYESSLAQQSASLPRTPQASPAVPKGPAIARVARLRLTTADFDAARGGVERMVNDKGGWFKQLHVTGSYGQSRALSAVVLVPANRLDALMAEVRGLGVLREETNQAEDIGEEIVDVQARLSNARNTERRLSELLRTRTGKIEDVLEAEREVTRVREEIERLDAQRQHLERRVTYATLSIDVAEELRASVDLGPRPISSRLSDAFRTGLGQGLQGLIEITVMIARVLPIVFIWAVVLAWPIRMLWRWKNRDTSVPPREG